MMKHIDNMTSDKCSGCTACMAVCPIDAIKMTSDEEGFYVPKTDTEKCIDCTSCVKVCRQLSDAKEKKYDNTAFAVIYDNNEIRKNSSSGAYFQAVAEHFLDIGGYVCGCILENMKVKHIVSDKLDDVRRMADSKYVQSDMGNCFRQIKKLLDSDKSVLFSGTSCQVDGLRSYLSLSGTDTSGLLCIDFFCHGVPSPLIWKEYINFYQRVKHRKPVGYKWRCKDYGWGTLARGRGHLNTLQYESGGKRRSDRSIISRSWRQIFFSNLVLRRKCHRCSYCNVNKPSDITMGDFWKIENVIPEFDDTKGTSLVIVHNAEKLKFVNEIHNLKYAEVNVDDAIKGQANAFAPSPKNENRELFWKEYRNNGFNYVMRKYFVPYIRYIKEPVKKILFLLGLRNY